jgi:hypothetical protein
MLARDHHLAPLVNRAEQLSLLQQQLTAIAPPELARGCRVANLRHGTVILHVTSNAAAAKLKHFLPRLVDGFRSSCADVNSAKIEVQFLTRPTSGAGQRKRSVLAPPAAPLLRLADALPDTPLREAVRALAKRSR